MLLALFIPMVATDDPEHSPLEDLEHDLHGTVAFAILPLFAFANAGISLQGAGFAQLFHSVPFGITAGLFIGKQVGHRICFITWPALQQRCGVLANRCRTFCQIYGDVLS